MWNLTFLTLVALLGCRAEFQERGYSRSRSPRNRRHTRSPSTRIRSRSRSQNTRAHTQSRNRSPRTRTHTRSRSRSPNTRALTRSRSQSQNARTYIRSRCRSPNARARTQSPNTREYIQSPSIHAHSRSPSAHSGTLHPEIYNHIEPSCIQNTEIPQELMTETPEIIPPNIAIPPTEQDMQQDAEREQDDIDTDILAAMGTIEEEPTNGPPAHSEIAQRWTPILTKGLKKEEKILLLKEYTPFSNIPAMIPPKLNPELSAAVSEPVKKRDTIIEYRQKNVAAALTAIGCGLECFLTKRNKVDGIKKINDAAKILCEVIHTETQGRRTLILNVINKEMKDSLQGNPDELLFGAGLTERIKTTKAVQRSAQDLGTTIVKQNNARANQRPLNLRVPPQPGYKHATFNRMKNANQHGGGGKKVPHTQNKMRRPPQQRRERERNYERNYKPRR